MSGDDGSDDQGASTISTMLRACEACKARKIRCDKLAPCSACKSANITCRTAKVAREKRQRVLISNKYEEQLENINSQLSQLKNTLHDLSKQNAQSVRHQPAFGATPPQVVPTPQGATTSQNTPSNDGMFLGESSFEMHSQQTTQALEKVLKNSPASVLDQDTTSALHSLRGLLKKGSITGSSKFSHDLPMPPAQLALKALRVAEKARCSFFLSAPMTDFNKFKEICQKVYFPVDGYSVSEFIIANGGLFTIFSDVPEDELKGFGIDPLHAKEAVAMCDHNITSTIEKLPMFLEATMGNIEALLVGVQLAVSRSRPHIAWLLTSTTARLCLDAGLHCYKDNADDAENNRKKTLFWYTYAMDKGLSLNFGRAPTFADFDITISYPEFPGEGFYALGIVWLDLARVQGRIYEKLYSAHGQLETRERKIAIAGSLISELQELRHCLKDILIRYPEDHGQSLEEPLMDTEMMVLTNMTLVNRVLPTSDPHPLRFAPDCITIAREALEAHIKLCARFSGRTDNSFRTYIDWNLLFCPFTPFIVILGTATINSDVNDLRLLRQVVDSLEDACQRSVGAKRLHDICKLLYKGAETCIQQSVANTSHDAVSATAALQGHQIPATAYFEQNGLGTDTFTGQMPMDNWPAFQVGSADDMSMLFDNYLVGNSSMMGFFEQDLGRFEPM